MQQLGGNRCDSIILKLEGYMIIMINIVKAGTGIQSSMYPVLCVDLASHVMLHQQA